MILGLIQHRKFIWRNAFHEFRFRYAGSGMGVLWNIAHPLAMIGIYSLVFGGIMGTKGSRLSYAVYLCSGLIPWMAFAECVTRGCAAFVTNANYLRKLPIPEPVFIAQVLVASCINLAISFGLLVIFAVAVGERPTVYWLLVPIPLAALLLLGFAIATVVGTLNVFFRDMQEWVGIALGALMWTLPIVYRIDGFLPAAYQRVLPWHPMFPAITAVRDLFLHKQLPDAWTWCAMLAWPAGVWLIGTWLLGRVRDEIRDVI